MRNFFIIVAIIILSASYYSKSSHYNSINPFSSTGNTSDKTNPPKNTTKRTSYIGTPTATPYTPSRSTGNTNSSYGTTSSSQTGSQPSAFKYSSPMTSATRTSSSSATTTKSTSSAFKYSSPTTSKPNFGFKSNSGY